jgi:hypothetical protein
LSRSCNICLDGAVIAERSQATPVVGPAGSNADNIVDRIRAWIHRVDIIVIGVIACGSDNYVVLSCCPLNGILH